MPGPKPVSMPESSITLPELLRFFLGYDVLFESKPKIPSAADDRKLEITKLTQLFELYDSLSMSLLGSVVDAAHGRDKLAAELWQLTISHVSNAVDLLWQYDELARSLEQQLVDEQKRLQAAREYTKQQAVEHGRRLEVMKERLLADIMDDIESRDKAQPTAMVNQQPATAY